MPNVLEVQIVGDVSALEKSLKQAEKLQAEYTSSIEKTSKELAENIAISRNYAKAVEELDKELKSGSISSKEYSSQLSKLKKDEQETKVATADLRKELANLKREQKDLGNGFQKDLTPKIANGGNTLMQFSRIAQDAPFGIIGIGNNITATVESFGHLSKSAGGAGAALKAVASSMLGSGGILLAVSLVTTGLTYMAQNGLTVGDVFDKLTGSFDENAKALSEINKEAAKTAGEEIATIKGLVSAASDVTLSTEKRLLAVKKLQDEYPSYFGNLTREQILNGNVAGAVDDVSKALIARARAAAIAGKLGELAAKRLELEEKREQAILDITKQQQYVRKQIAKASAGERDLGTSAEEFAKINLQAVVDQYNNVKKEIAEVDTQSKKLSDTQSKATKDSINLLETQTEAEKELAAAKKKAAEEAAANRERKKLMPKVTAIPKIEIGKSTDEENDKALQIMRDRLSEDLTRLKVDGVEVNIPVQAVADDFNFSAYAKQLELAKEQTQIFADATGSAIGALGNQIAASLETGNAALDAFVGSVIQSLADIAAAQLAGLIAQQAIATQEITTSAGVSTAKAIESGTKTAAASGPAAAFVLPALVGAAIGFIAASFAGIKFAHGGVVPGGSFTGDKVPAMLNSGEAVMNSQQQANTLMAIANGNSNALQGNVRIDTFTLETALRGSDLLLAIKREERKR